MLLSFRWTSDEHILVLGLAAHAPHPPPRLLLRASAHSALATWFSVYLPTAPITRRIFAAQHALAKDQTDFLPQHPSTAFMPHSSFHNATWQQNTWWFASWHCAHGSIWTIPSSLPITPLLLTHHIELPLLACACTYMLCTLLPSHLTCPLTFLPLQPH